jgi:hypothetical protein
MKPISEADSLYECVYLAGHPALTTSNSNQPPGSFHSKDVFTSHPTISGRWKYVSRLDDRINLANGEKVLPLPFEGRVKQHRFVHDAVLVGVGRVAPGLLIVKADLPELKQIPDTQYISSIWPVIQEANSQAEDFSQISRDLIALLPYDAKFPRTDKGSMIRAQVYELYSELIEDLYAKESSVTGGLQLDADETECVLLRLAREELQMPISGAHANFFSEGVDSLKAIHFRRLICQRFSFDQNQIPGSNIIFEAGSISKLAQHICSLQDGNEIPKTEDATTRIRNLINKYSVFQKHIPQSHSFSSSSSVVRKMEPVSENSNLTLRSY